MKRAFSALLLAALLVSSFTSCGEKPAEGADDSAVTTAPESVAETEADIFEGLPPKPTEARIMSSSSVKAWKASSMRRKKPASFSTTPFTAAICR